MKKGMRSLLSALSVLALFLAFPLGAGRLLAADSGVEYRGRAEQLVFLPGGDDLFINYKGMLPGDAREQIIKISNRGERAIRLKLTALPADAADLDFLAAFNIRIAQGDTEHYDAPLEPLQSLSTAIDLGTVLPGASFDLRLLLELPATAGNEVMERSARVKWLFEALEDEPAPSPTPVPSPTPTSAPEPTPTTTAQQSEPSTSRGPSATTTRAAALPRTGEFPAARSSAALGLLGLAGLLIILRKIKLKRG